jgi:hypothetical protein
MCLLSDSIEAKKIGKLVTRIFPCQNGSSASSNRRHGGSINDNSFMPKAKRTSSALSFTKSKTRQTKLFDMSQPSWTVNLEWQDLGVSPLSLFYFKNIPVISMTLAGREMHKFKAKNWAWLLEGEHFYSTLEYGPDGVVIKYYKKLNFTIDNVYEGLIGDSDDIYFDDTFNTRITYGNILSIVNNLKYKYNKRNFQLNKFDSNDFVKELGFLFDPNFAVYLKKN